MEKTTHLSLTIAGLILIFFLQGCATHIRQPAESPQPAKVRLSEYSNIKLAHVKISPQFGEAKANQKAMAKIDEKLFSCMHSVLPNITEASSESDSNYSPSSLQIEPLIEEIKFIGGAARFWLGAMAGNSAVLMKVRYFDSSTGEVIAEPEFYRNANAMGGSWSMGATDNRMLEDVAQDVCNYTSNNR